MNIEQFREYCLQFKGVSEELPFGPNTLVFKVLGKIFALTDIDNFSSINLKCDPELAVELRERYADVQPGYHMSKKHWNTVTVNAGVPDVLIQEWITNSYHLAQKGSSTTKR